MLNNLTPRERTLAMLVLGLAPILLLFWAFTSWTGTYRANQSRIASLLNQIQRQEELQSGAELAQQRRFLYRDSGLPADPNMGRIQYAAWLNDAIEKQAGLNLQSVDPVGSQTLRYRQGGRLTDVCEQYTWKVVAEGNLGQLLKFLQEFQSLDMVHRISALNLKPKVVGGGGQNSLSRTGLLRIEAEIQALAMVDADMKRDFASATQEVPELQSMIERVRTRNIFGPANNPPRITSSMSRSAEEGEAVSFDISADDAEDAAGLRFELVSSSVEGAALKPTSNPARVMFESPPLSADRYKFTVRVTDSGFPPKSVERELTLTVARKAVARVEPEPPPPPPFKHVQATKITALTAIGDRRECWVEVQTLGKRYRLGEGESFELDGQTWTVRTISLREDSVILECAGELRRVKRGKTLDQPVASEALTGGTVPAEKAD